MNKRIDHQRRMSNEIKIKQPVIRELNKIEWRKAIKTWREITFGFLNNTRRAEPRIDKLPTKAINNVM